MNQSTARWIYRPAKNQRRSVRATSPRTLLFCRFRDFTATTPRLPERLQAGANLPRCHTEQHRILAQIRRTMKRHRQHFVALQTRSTEPIFTRHLGRSTTEPSAFSRGIGPFHAWAGTNITGNPRYSPSCPIVGNHHCRPDFPRNDEFPLYSSTAIVILIALSFGSTILWTIECAIG